MGIENITRFVGECCANQAETPEPFEVLDVNYRINITDIGKFVEMLSKEFYITIETEKTNTENRIKLRMADIDGAVYYEDGLDYVKETKDYFRFWDKKTEEPKGEFCHKNIYRWQALIVPARLGSIGYWRANKRHNSKQSEDEYSDIVFGKMRFSISQDFAPCLENMLLKVAVDKDKCSPGYGNPVYRKVSGE